jgi:hypothetical protein
MKFLRARPSQILRGVIIVNVLALVWSLPAAAAPDRQRSSRARQSRRCDQ